MTTTNIDVYQALVTGSDSDKARSTDRVAAVILLAITKLAQEVGISVTAEGIETETQRSEVVAVGGDSSQGYLKLQAIL